MISGCPQKRQPVHAGHFQVTQNEIKRGFFYMRHGLLAVTGRVHLKPVSPEKRGQHVPHVFFVIDNQNFFQFIRLPTPAT
jgi:hypothetical protein